MFKIIKAEYSYLAFGSIHSLLIVLALIVFYKTADVVILNRITFMIGILLIAHLIRSRNTEKRSFTEMLLPLSIKQMAIARLVIILIPIILLYSISIFLNIYFLGFHFGWDDTIFELFSLGLISIFFTYVYYFLSDLFSVFTTKKGKIIYNISIGIIVAIAALFTIITTEKSYVVSLTSGIMLNIFELLGIIFFALVTIYTFQQKESHIE